MFAQLTVVFLIGSSAIVFAEDHHPHYITTGYGTPLQYKDAILTVGRQGPMLIEDVEFIDEMSHFDHERNPERVVHAKGAGAFGYFEVTNDITQYCAAALFSRVGKRTNITVRFSAVSGERGSSDTARDPRGFSVKFYTEEGNWDLTGNNIPIFFIRDPILFPSLIHTQKRHPANNLHDSNMKWDFFTLRPETVHMLLYLFSDRGTPDGYRYMHGFGVNTFKLVNATGSYVYCKFQYLSNQGLRNLTAQQAAEIQAFDLDYATRDLYYAIERGDYPSWTLYIQVMTEEQTHEAPFNPFDDTKIWPTEDYPLVEVGKLVLNRNPTNFYEEVEQAAFTPSRMVPGIRPSQDKMLQGRLFSYPDTQRHRLGRNFLQLPINCPFAKVGNYQRDGPMAYFNQGNATNYHPNSVDHLVELGTCDKERCLFSPYYVSGAVGKYDSGDEDNFSQATEFYNELSEIDRAHLIENLAESIAPAKLCYQKRAVEMFFNVSAELGSQLAAKLNLTEV